MAHFRATQFEIIATVVNRFTNRFDKQLRAHDLDLGVANLMINDLVNELCIEFRQDNGKFNETLFRSKCGIWVSKENCTVNYAIGE